MKVKIKLARKHPQQSMPFGRHSITYSEKVIELNEAEILDLKNDGPKHWFIFDEVKDKPVKKVSKKVTKRVK